MKHVRKLENYTELLAICARLEFESVGYVTHYRTIIKNHVESRKSPRNPKPSAFFRLAWDSKTCELWVHLDLSAFQSKCENLQLLQKIKMLHSRHDETEAEKINRMIEKANNWLFGTVGGNVIDLTAERAEIDCNNGFDISESSGGVHRHSQGDLYPIIMFSKGINAERQFYLYGSHVIHKETITNQQLQDFVEILRGTNRAEKEKVAQWFAKNGYPYNSEY